MFQSVLTNDFLIEEYKNKKKTKARIAREVGTTTTTILKYLNKFAISNNTKSDYLDDIIGQRFSRLLVIERAENDKFGKRKYKCICDCGKKLIINASSLKRKLTNSCGCYKSELAHKGYKDISASFWRRLKDSAYSRDLDFDITPEYIWSIYELQNKKCALTGLEIDFCQDNNKPYKRTASIDRIDSYKGYVEGNIQIIHKVVNLMKSHFDNDIFISVCNLIAKKHTIDNELCLEKVSYMKLADKNNNSK